MSHQRELLCCLCNLCTIYQMYQTRLLIKESLGINTEHTHMICHIRKYLLTQNTINHLRFCESDILLGLKFKDEKRKIAYGSQLRSGEAGTPLTCANVWLIFSAIALATYRTTICVSVCQTELEIYGRDSQLHSWRQRQKCTNGQRQFSVKNVWFTCKPRIFVYRERLFLDKRTIFCLVLTIL